MTKTSAGASKNANGNATPSEANSASPLPRFYPHLHHYQGRSHCERSGNKTCKALKLAMKPVLYSMHLCVTKYSKSE